MFPLLLVSLACSNHHIFSESQQFCSQKFFLLNRSQLWTANNTLQNHAFLNSKYWDYLINCEGFPQVSLITTISFLNIIARQDNGCNACIISSIGPHIFLFHSYHIETHLLTCKDCWCINEKVRDQIVGEELIKFAFHLNNREGASPPTVRQLITMPQVLVVVVVVEG